MPNHIYCIYKYIYKIYIPSTSILSAISSRIHTQSHVKHIEMMGADRHRATLILYKSQMGATIYIYILKRVCFSFTVLFYIIHFDAELTFDWIAWLKRDMPRTAKMACADIRYGHRTTHNHISATQRCDGTRRWSAGILDNIDIRELSTNHRRTLSIRYYKVCAVVIWTFLSF